ncbi:hypothetical protein F5883DRAFT_541424 [Diaporthe sp. PMI_573]|nr:hypothetical protein F5883DRAFT_541424 [Diaporthaceae sp. PMI_573]
MVFMARPSLVFMATFSAGCSDNLSRGDSHFSLPEDVVEMLETEISEAALSRRPAEGFAVGVGTSRLWPGSWSWSWF